MIKKILLWIAVIFVSIMIFGFSSTSGSESKNLSEKVTKKIVHLEENKEAEEDVVFKKIHVFIRKMGHFLEFALLGALVFFLVKSYNASYVTCLVIALSYSLLFAITDEIHQLLVDGRDGKVLDVIIDFCGSFLSAGMCYFKMRHIKKSS